MGVSGEWRNQLFFGDNLDILREHVADESVDLVYLDPPFNSNANYNVLFAEKTGQKSAAQIEAFGDSWEWGPESERVFHEIVTSGPRKLADLVQAMRSFLGQNDVMAYLTMIAIRLVELRRVLKPTGSIYLHCDPTASHYLKLLLDAVFGAVNFRNEIVWKRTTAHGDTKQGSRHFGRIHDTIFRYTKTESFVWNPMLTPYDQEYIDTYYRFVDASGRRYWKDNLTAAKPGGDTRYEWRIRRLVGTSEWIADLDNEYLEPREGWEYKGIVPAERRFWAYSKANMVRMASEGRIVHSSNGLPMYKRFLDEMPGRPVQDWWDDIRGLGGLGSNKEERLNYPTQKPEALLERIIKASSNEGDLVLDPFCGCGTTINVSERLHRRWIGVDVTHLAITLIKRRLKDTFGPELAPYEVIGVPKDLSGAEELAKENRHQFEWWALDLVEARPAQDKKKGADSGVDGYIYFFDDNSGKAKRIVVQVKSGHVSVSVVRDLKGVLQREQAEIGVLVTLQEPTKQMEQEAIATGFYTPQLFPGSQYPKIQILTIAELLSGTRSVQFPKVAPTATFKQAQRKSKERQLQGELM